MGLRKEIGLLNKLLQDIEQYHQGSRSFGSLYDLIEDICSSLHHLNAHDRNELNSFKNGFEVLQFYPKTNNENDCASMMYEYSPKISEKEQLVINEELILLIKLLHEIQGKIILLYCPSCGYDLTDLINNADIFSIHCPCCGLPRTLFYGNQSSIIQEFRDKWLTHPTYWYDRAAYSEDWSFEQQIERIPFEMT